MTSVWSRRIRAPIFAGISIGSIVLTALAVLAFLVGPVLLNNAFYMHILQQIAFYTIAAIGLNLLVGYQGQVSLGHGGLFAVGAYASAIASTRLGVPVWIALLIGPAVSGMV